MLVVDDDAALRLLCRVNLELDGYRVLEAATIAAARGALDAETVDLVLLDVSLGAEDGLSLARELRQDGPRPSVALLTGTEDIGEEGRGLADGVIPKPFSLEQLCGTVRRLAGP